MHKLSLFALCRISYKNWKMYGRQPRLRTVFFSFWKVDVMEIKGFGWTAEKCKMHLMKHSEALSNFQSCLLCSARLIFWQNSTNAEPSPPTSVWTLKHKTFSHFPMAHVPDQHRKICSTDPRAKSKLSTKLQTGDRAGKQTETGEKTKPPANFFTHTKKTLQLLVDLSWDKLSSHRWPVPADGSQQHTLHTTALKHFIYRLIFKTYTAWAPASRPPPPASDQTWRSDGLFFSGSQHQRKVSNFIRHIFALRLITSVAFPETRCSHHH